MLKIGKKFASRGNIGKLVKYSLLLPISTIVIYKGWYDIDTRDNHNRADLIISVAADVLDICTKMNNKKIFLDTEELSTYNNIGVEDHCEAKARSNFSECIMRHFSSESIRKGENIYKLEDKVTFYKCLDL
jgi:hypothetical protein